MTTIALKHPERYWLAVRTDVPWLRDPDVADRRQRWDDRDWAAIAAAVRDVMDELGAGRGRVEPVDEDDAKAGVQVVVDIDLDHLDPVDREIVCEWFVEGLGPIADPWLDLLENGRHRLWSCWRAAPETVLPVYCGQLLWLDSVPYMGDDFAAGVYRGAMEGIELIPPAVMKRNPSFCDELRRVARLGGYDGLTPGVRWSDGDRNLYDAVLDDPDLLPHILAGQPLVRHDPVPPPGLHDVRLPQHGVYERDGPVEDRRGVALRWVAGIVGVAAVIVVSLLVILFVIARR